MNKGFRSIESKNILITVENNTVHIKHKPTNNSIDYTLDEFHELYNCMYAVEQEMNDGIH